MPAIEVDGVVAAALEGAVADQLGVDAAIARVVDVLGASARVVAVVKNVNLLHAGSRIDGRWSCFLLKRILKCPRPHKGRETEGQEVVWTVA
jgi:hypothetical protein